MRTPTVTKTALRQARRALRFSSMLYVTTFEGRRYFTDRYVLGELACFPVIDTLVTEAGGGSMEHASIDMAVPSTTPLAATELPSGPNISTFVPLLAEPTGPLLPERLVRFDVTSRSDRKPVHILAIQVRSTQTQDLAPYVNLDRLSFFTEPSENLSYQATSDDPDKPLVVSGTARPDSAAPLLVMPYYGRKETVVEELRVYSAAGGMLLSACGGPSLSSIE